jgi:hypothetical protein
VVVIVVQVVVSFLDVPGGRRENWGVVAYVLPVKLWPQLVQRV